MVPLGTKAPDFSLPDITGEKVSRKDFRGQPLLVAFICNHCPYVKHIATGLAAAAQAWQGQGVAVVAINSNDVENYPEDSPELMVEEAANRGYSFPYLFDEPQSVAREFDAQCTPDFFLFDDEHRLVYRGQMDDARPGNDEPVTGEDISAAIAALQQGETLATQTPSIGCNIKWKQ